MPPKNIKAKKNTKNITKAGKQAAPKSFQVVAFLFFFTALLIFAYEIVRYFFFPAALVPEIFSEYKNPFLLAKIWLFGAALAGGVEILRQKDKALLFGIISGSLLIFIGLTDVLFNIGQGFYSALNFPVVFESIVNLFSLIFGIYSVNFLWDNRHFFVENKNAIPLVKKKKW